MYVRKLKIENVKAFAELDLSFERPGKMGTDRYAGLNVFVGGNSAGKSTLLKTIAMAVSGPTVAIQQIVSTAGWVRKGAKRAVIELQLEWDTLSEQFKGKGGNPTTNGFQAGLVFEADSVGANPTLKSRYYSTTSTKTKIRSAERGPWNPDAPGWLLGAYGPLRRLTGSSTEALRFALARGKLSSCVTLFREDAALSESETWLKQEHARALEAKSQHLKPSTLVEDVTEFLNAGLLPAGFRITAVTVDQVCMSTPNGGELPLRDLSDGCRSAYALMLDIIHSMAVTYGGDVIFERSPSGVLHVGRPGVILIDELEAHLHPSWQRTICDWLRSRFPAVQFFVTTHSPLIAQEADDEGLFVLPLPEELASGQDARRLTLQEQEKVRLGKAEKVLLGEAFGLKRTWGLKADRVVKEWEKLSAQKEVGTKWSPQERAEFEKVSKQVEIVFDDPPAPDGNA